MRTDQDKSQPGQFSRPEVNHSNQMHPWFDSACDQKII